MASKLNGVKRVAKNVLNMSKHGVEISKARQNENSKQFQRQFMHVMLQRMVEYKLKSNNNHPLSFLLNKNSDNWQSRIYTGDESTNPFAVQAGHVIPKSILWGDEFLAIESAAQNIKSGNKDTSPKTVICIKGVYVEEKSAMNVWIRELEKHGKKEEAINLKLEIDMASSAIGWSPIGLHNRTINVSH